MLQNNVIDINSKIEIKQSDACDLLQSLKQESVQVIITDPPYGIAYHSNHYVGKNPHAPITRDWNFEISPFLNAAANVLKDAGVLYLFTRWDVYPLWVQSVIPPFKLKNVIIWKKDNWSAGDLQGDFGNQYEMLMMCTKGKFKLRGHRWSNVWEFPRVPAKKMLHPTQKPVELVQRAIEASSDTEDLIVDPFSGSGTTGEAALRCNRRVILGDIDSEMIRLMCKRFNLKLPDSLEKKPVSNPTCPVFKVTPPELSLWGVHPEDIAYVYDQCKNNQTNIETATTKPEGEN